MAWKKAERAVTQDICTILDTNGVRVLIQGHPPLVITHEQAENLRDCLGRVLRKGSGTPIAATFTKAS